MEDRDSGRSTTALVTALWRAAWIWRWFVQPAIVWFGGGQTAQTPTPTSLHCAVPPLEPWQQ